MRRRGGGGDPGGGGPDLFRIFREKAMALRTSAKNLLRPQLPPSGDMTVTPALVTFNRIAAGGVSGTFTAARVLLAHRFWPEPRNNT
ncbi:MAG: hypothetical protein HYU57_02380 [Micavibrio aeruginosavorus]|nr:hypothetical protein [Micavibrio aeruginosavorus]